MKSLFSLPDSLLVEILSLLPVSDLIRMQFLNHHLFHLLQSCRRRLRRCECLRLSVEIRNALGQPSHVFSFERFLYPVSQEGRSLRLVVRFSSTCSNDALRPEESKMGSERLAFATVREGRSVADVLQSVLEAATRRHYFECASVNGVDAESLRVISEFCEVKKLALRQGSRRDSSWEEDHLLKFIQRSQLQVFEAELATGLHLSKSFFLRPEVARISHFSATVFCSHDSSLGVDDEVLKKWDADAFSIVGAKTQISHEGIRRWIMKSSTKTGIRSLCLLPFDESPRFDWMDVLKGFYLVDSSSTLWGRQVNFAICQGSPLFQLLFESNANAWRIQISKLPLNVSRTP